MTILVALTFSDSFLGIFILFPKSCDFVLMNFVDLCI